MSALGHWLMGEGAPLTFGVVASFGIIGLFGTVEVLHRLTCKRCAKGLR